MIEIKLSPKQQEMIDYIKSYIKTNGMAPNATEAALHFEKSRQACVDIMDRLKELGVIDFNKHGVRSMKILGESEAVPVNLKAPIIEINRGNKSGPKITRAYETETPEVKIKTKFLTMAWR